MTRILFVIFSVALLIYLILPGPSTIGDISPLPNALKSNLPGDTVQTPNVAGYFSNTYRGVVVPFYQEDYRKKTMFFFLPLKLNYPPEFAPTAIRDQTYSTFLEELVYPMRDSLYVNGMEPLYEDGSPRYPGAVHYLEEGQYYETKTTLRFYPSPVWARLLTWVGVVTSVFLLWKLGRRIILNA